MTKRDAIEKDCWIVGQLAGIRLMEQELTQALRKPGTRNSKELQQRVAKLNSWVSMVDQALSHHAV